MLVWNQAGLRIETVSLDDKAQHPTEWCLFGSNRQVQIETLSLDVKAHQPTESCLFTTDCAAPLPQTVAAKFLTFGPMKGLSRVEKKEIDSDRVHLSS